MRLLMVTNKVKTYALGFHNIFEPLQRLGHEVVWAADFSGFVADKSIIPYPVEQISIHTNPFHSGNINAYRKLLTIIDNYRIEGVLCSTPIGGALARLAARKKKIAPVLYEAHGFLFFKGAPLINRTVYKWEEAYLSRYTDYLITITEEDFDAAKSLKLRNGDHKYLVHGAGVNVGVQVYIDKAAKRKSIGIPEDAFVIVSAGELNKNKNTEVIVSALKEFKGKNVHYVACGVGPEESNLKELAAQLGVTSTFHLLGYRTDIAEIMAASDVFCMMSFREGMPRALLEAMDLGLPCVGSDTRGIRDLIDAGQGGYICGTSNPEGFATSFAQLMEHPELRTRMGQYNRHKVKDYSSEVVKQELFDIYREAFGSNETD